MATIQISYLTVMSLTLNREVSDERASEILALTGQEKLDFIEAEANKEPMGFAPYRAEGVDPIEHARIELAENKATARDFIDYGPARR